MTDWKTRYESAMQDWADDHNVIDCEYVWCQACVTLGAWDPELLKGDLRTEVVRAAEARRKAEAWV